MNSQEQAKRPAPSKNLFLVAITFLGFVSPVATACQPHQHPAEGLTPPPPITSPVSPGHKVPTLVPSPSPLPTETPAAPAESFKILVVTEPEKTQGKVKELVDYATTFRVSSDQGEKVLITSQQVVFQEGKEGGNDILVTSLLTQKKKDSGVKLVTEKGPEGELENHLIIAVAGKNNGQDYVGYYRLPPATEEKMKKAIAEGNTNFSIEPSQILAANLIYSYTLRRGYGLADFQEEVKKAETLEEAREVLLKYVDHFTFNYPDNSSLTVSLNGTDEDGNPSYQEAIDTLASLFVKTAHAAEPEATPTPPETPTAEPTATPSLAIQFTEVRIKKEEDKELAARAEKALEVAARSDRLPAPLDLNGDGKVRLGVSPYTPGIIRIEAWSTGDEGTDPNRNKPIWIYYEDNKGGHIVPIPPAPGHYRRYWGFSSISYDLPHAHKGEGPGHLATLKFCLPEGGTLPEWAKKKNITVTHDGFQITAYYNWNNGKWTKILPHERRDGKYELLTGKQYVEKIINNYGKDWGLLNSDDKVKPNSYKILTYTNNQPAIVLVIGGKGGAKPPYGLTPELKNPQVFEQAWDRLMKISPQTLRLFTYVYGLKVIGGDLKGGETFSRKMNRDWYMSSYDGNNGFLEINEKQMKFPNSSYALFVILDETRALAHDSNKLLSIQEAIKLVEEKPSLATILFPGININKPNYIKYANYEYISLSNNSGVDKGKWVLWWVDKHSDSLTRDEIQQLKKEANFVINWYRKNS